MSELCTASLPSVIAFSFPSPTAFLINSSMPGSTIGLRPLLMMSTFTWFTSTPITSCPSSAKQAADTQPTYPSPKMLNLMFPLSSRALARRSVHNFFAHLHESLGRSLPAESFANERARLFAYLRRKLRVTERANHCLREIFRLV